MSWNIKRFTKQDSARVSDGSSKDLFFKIIEYLESAVPLLFNFRFYAVTLDSAVTDYEVKHGQKSAPIDVILLSNSSSAVTVTFKYEKFTDEGIILSTSGACRIRFLAGKYKGI